MADSYWADADSGEDLVRVTDSYTLGALRRAVEPRQPLEFGKGIDAGKHWPESIAETDRGIEVAGDTDRDSQCPRAIVSIVLVFRMLVADLGYVNARGHAADQAPGGSRTRASGRSIALAGSGSPTMSAMAHRFRATMRLSAAAPR